MFPHGLRQHPIPVKGSLNPQRGHGPQVEKHCFCPIFMPPTAHRDDSEVPDAAFKVLNNSVPASLSLFITPERTHPQPDCSTGLAYTLHAFSTHSGLSGSQDQRVRPHRAASAAPLTPAPKIQSLGDSSVDFPTYLRCRALLSDPVFLQRGLGHLLLKLP